MIAVIRTFHIYTSDNRSTHICGTYTLAYIYTPNSYNVVLYTGTLQVVVTRRMVELFSCLLDPNDRGRALNDSHLLIIYLIFHLDFDSNTALRFRHQTE